MKLYYSPGSCSTSCHITLEESGLPYQTIQIDFEKSNDPNVALVEKLNPLGTIPVLITDDQKQLDQNISIHTYVADLVPEKKLLPPVGTYERAVAMNWLSFVASDLHKSIGGLFALDAYAKDKNTQDAVRKNLISISHNYLSYLDKNLAGKDYLLGKNFSSADAYAFVVVGWTRWLDMPIAQYTHIQNFLARMNARPSVAKVLKDEGLL